PPTATDNCGGVITGTTETELPITSSTTITWSYAYGDGESLTQEQEVLIADSEAPVVVTQDVTIHLGPGETASIDPEDIDNGSTDNCEIVSYNLDKDQFSEEDEGTNTVTLFATDVAGNVGSATATVTIILDGTGPCIPAEILSISSPSTPSLINEVVTVTVEATGTITEATWTWGDGSETIVSAPFSSLSARHQYETPGIYIINLSIKDDCGVTSSSDSEMVVIFDPYGGFVNGNGWIWSPKGAYTFNTNAEGRANFNFVARYDNDGSGVQGNAQFRFNLGQLRFRSTMYEENFLLIGNHKVILKGEGLINNESGFEFMIFASDGDLNPIDQNDKFRIKIWRTSNGEIVYDNEMGNPDSADPITGLGGGNINIHVPKARNISGSNKRVIENNGKDKDGMGNEGMSYNSIALNANPIFEVEWNTPWPEIVNAEFVITEENKQLEFDDINWDLTSFTPMISGFHQINGKYQLSELNGDQRELTIYVLVKDKPIPLGISLDNSQINRDIKKGQIIGNLYTLDTSDDLHFYYLNHDQESAHYFEIKENQLVWNGSGDVPKDLVLDITSEDRVGQKITEKILISREVDNIRDVFIPNVFTPNNDGVNDTWGIPGMKNYGSPYRISVYDQSGIMVFSTNDAENKWDGKFEGKDMPVGAYFYLLENLENGEKRKGVLNLLNK
ncbi:T9SS type B sorting domain-containing protein, partial [Pleomorphovibrio marinus]|uniref:T9SS type B sorting domain-containing protein n=1 Tax=Pleomorphovibrio marinus TaxID=2164132 RepID=UPI0013002105